MLMWSSSRMVNTLTMETRNPLSSNWIKHAGHIRKNRSKGRRMVPYMKNVMSHAVQRNVVLHTDTNTYFLFGTLKNNTNTHMHKIQIRANYFCKNRLKDNIFEFPIKSLIANFGPTVTSLGLFENKFRLDGSKSFFKKADPALPHLDLVDLPAMVWKCFVMSPRVKNDLFPTTIFPNLFA